MNKLSAFILLLAFSSASVSATYEFKIKKIQANEMGHTHLAIYPDQNITDSACEMSNTTDRFNMTSEVQYSAALAAVMADKTITLQTTGACNSGNLETVSYIMIHADK